MALSLLQQAVGKLSDVGDPGVRGCLSFAVPIVILIAIVVYYSFPQPTYDQARLEAVARESRGLMAANPIGADMEPIEIPQDKWPPAIASLKPVSVTVRRRMVDITTKPFFDGGWGYGFATDKQNLTMLAECWWELGHDVYWHGPC